MRKEKNEAIALRKAGLSYLQIGAKLNLPKSTLSYWLREIEVSAKLLSNINKRANKKSREALIKRNKLQTKLAIERSEKIKSEAIAESRKLISQELFCIGVALYWAEGYKMGDKGSKWKSFDFANSDPSIIRLMTLFINKYLPECFDKIVIQIIAHKNIDIEKSIKYWSKITGIKSNKFIKTTIYKNDNSKGIRNTKRLPYGTIHLRINSVAVFFRMIGWIEGIKINNGV